MASPLPNTKAPAFVKKIAICVSSSLKEAFVAGNIASDGKKTVTLELGSLKPVMQMKIKYNIKAASGTDLKQEIHNTINKVPTMTKAAL